MRRSRSTARRWTHEPGRDPRAPFVDWMLTRARTSAARWSTACGSTSSASASSSRSMTCAPAIRRRTPSCGRVLNREFVATRLRPEARHAADPQFARLSAQLGDAARATQTDTRFYSHYYARRLPAEVLLDAIAAATGVPDKFDGYPLGLRAIQLPDPGVGSYFLTLFGRSDRVTACACERNGEVTLPQLLHLQERRRTASSRSPRRRPPDRAAQANTDDARRHRRNLPRHRQPSARATRNAPRSTQRSPPDDRATTSSATCSGRC